MLSLLLSWSLSVQDSSCHVIVVIVVVIVVVDVVFVFVIIFIVIVAVFMGLAQLREKRFVISFLPE